MFKYDFNNRPIASTLPFWQLVTDEFKNLNISYINLTQARNWSKKKIDSFLENIDNADFYFLDFSSEAFYDYHSEILNHLKGKNFLNLTCDPIWFFKEHETTAFLPCWYYDVYYTNRANAREYLARSARLDKQYAVSCLNRAVKIPRIYNLVKLYKHGLLNDPRMLLTFKPYNVYISDDSLLPNDDKRIVYPQDMDWTILKSEVNEQELADIKNTYTMLFSDLPLNPLNEDLTKNLDDHTLRHPAYMDSHANLITESITYNLFYTEKTFKALAAGLPFWLQGGSNSCLYLDLFGFDTFKDIEFFDYSNYDLERSFVKRTNIITNLASAFIKQTDFTKYDMSARIVKNQEMFYSKKTYNMFFQYILSKIRTIVS